MTDEQIQRECLAAINEIWQAFKPRVVSVNQSQAYWDDAMETFEGIVTKYAGTPVAALAKRLSVACVNALEDRYRELFWKER